MTIRDPRDILAALVGRASTPPWRAAARALGVSVGAGSSIAGWPIIDRRRGGTIALGERCRLVSSRHAAVAGAPFPVTLRTMSPGAAIVIGEDVGMTGAAVVARGRVEIGDRTLIGPGVRVLSGDAHPVDVVPRRYAPAPPTDGSHDVTIGADVWLGAGVTVLGGTTIGRGSVIAAGAVVTGSIPAFTLAGGVPARPLRALRLSDTSSEDRAGVQ